MYVVLPDALLIGVVLLGVTPIAVVLIGVVPIAVVHIGVAVSVDAAKFIRTRRNL